MHSLGSWQCWTQNMTTHTHQLSTLCTTSWIHTCICVSPRHSLGSWQCSTRNATTRWGARMTCSWRAMRLKICRISFTRCRWGVRRICESCWTCESWMSHVAHMSHRKGVVGFIRCRWGVRRICESYCTCEPEWVMSRTHIRVASALLAAGEDLWVMWGRNESCSKYESS